MSYKKEKRKWRRKQYIGKIASAAGMLFPSAHLYACSRTLKVEETEFCPL